MNRFDLSNDVMKRLIGIGFLALALPACTREEAQSTYPAFEAAEHLPLEICRVEGVEEPLLCGVLAVYEDRQAEAGRTIPIRVVVVPSQTERRTQSAWIEHQGGPRYSMVATAALFAAGGWLESFRRSRDIVLIDPRGLHESGPLYCDALKTPRILEPYYPVEWVKACRAELDERAALEHYSTINAIDDYEDIRRWLGYAKWDVGGWSFGSRFMLTYLHRYPESIRTVTLVIPSTLNFERPFDYARFGQQALDGVIADCAADAACNERFPSMEADLEKVLADLEAQPAVAAFTDPYTGQETSKALTPGLFAEAIWGALLGNESAHELPFILRHAAEGDFDPLIAARVPTSPPAPEPEGHYLSVVCPEETGRLDRAKALAAAEGTFLGGYYVEEYMNACDAWGLPLHRGHPITPEQFGVPALIVTGDRDPATPPEYGERNATHFENVLHITVPHMAHGTSSMENDCTTLIIDAFVDKGSVDGLDTSCVEKMRPPPFRLE